MKSFWFAVIAAGIWGVVPIIEKLGLGTKLEPMAGVVYRTVGSVIGAIETLGAWHEKGELLRNHYRAGT